MSHHHITYHSPLAVAPVTPPLAVAHHLFEPLDLLLPVFPSGQVVGLQLGERDGHGLQAHTWGGQGLERDCLKGGEEGGRAV